ncbi:hypothetical protein [Rhodovulum sulfidophilum]|uniref:NfeD-like C-terminal domain-containing protein n=2 Tax=Rhodovulum sulfidophilum TaxID=35806 RepID=A0ABS1RND3_RHOSU|nr:hypothetical protein [Rhodovulum sulfidophilum]ANB33437.1 hypothetical protein A6W98_04710 [Rhodovulum sulfidophilum DSM 1374]ANB37258.1 hypothetical protein A6024_04560 [Rhodovulum sulfidophilum]MBL3552474.1 hypothetical protein [Rhodovulum sulfidophilum]MBL3562993.1 hypothetical protein [Rhodovulum sulfidophilum]MBL3566318.1 hypothetical protein [Rhodovulum sulfidophilum]
MLETWWVWLAGAAVLAILEILAPVQVFFGVAVGAAAVGIALWLGLAVAWPWLLVIWGLVAGLSWLVLRRALGVRKGQVRIWDDDINEG